MTSQPAKLNGAVDLSLVGKKVKVGAPAPMAIMRHLDVDGTVEVPLVPTPQGPQPAMTRDQYLTADELIAEIKQAVREVVREELQAVRAMFEGLYIEVDPGSLRLEDWVGDDLPVAPAAAEYVLNEMAKASPAVD